jgi:hypothetical protein
MFTPRIVPALLAALVSASAFSLKLAQAQAP